MKLIDKDALVAEIEILQLCTMDEHMNFYSEAAEGEYNALSNLEYFLDTLEVKEVDLEKEIKDYFDNQPIITRSKGIDYQFIPSGEVIAKHFFELGLKARIDKELVEEVYSHLDSIKDTADRMTSGNFMHNRAAIKFSANTMAKVLELIGLKAQKGE